MPDYPRVGSGYELTANKGVASGYAELGANVLVPTSQLGSGTPTGNYLKGDQTWASPPGGTPNIKQTEVDFGLVAYKNEAEFTVADIDVTPLSQIVGNIAYEAPAGKDLDELEMDEISLKFAPGDGQLTIFAKGLDGSLEGKFKINYLVG